MWVSGTEVGLSGLEARTSPPGPSHCWPYCISFNCWSIHLLHIGEWRLAYMGTKEALPNIYHLWKPIRLLWRPREVNSYLGELELDPKFLRVKWDSGSSHHRGPPRTSGGQSQGQPTGGPAPHEDLGGDLSAQAAIPDATDEWFTRSAIYFSQPWGLASVTHVRKSPWASFMGTAMCFQRPFCSRNHPRAPYPNTIALMVTMAAYTLGSGGVHYNYYRAIRTTGASQCHPHVLSPVQERLWLLCLTSKEIKAQRYKMNTKIPTEASEWQSQNLG